MRARTWRDARVCFLTACLAAAALAGCGPSATSQPEQPPTEPKDSSAAAGDKAQPTPEKPGASSVDDKDSAATAANGEGGKKQEPLKAPPLFDGWPKPALALVLSGQQLGYIEPCGCTGLANQKGGLARRFTFIKQLREDRGWDVVPLDVGGQVRRFGKQSEIKFQRTAEGLRAMGYKAVALGADDLNLSSGELLAGTKPDDQPSIFTSANAAILSREFTPPWQITEAAGKKIGVIAVLGDAHEKKLQGDELVHGPALEALKEAAAQLQGQKCDFYVLLAHASLEESRQLAREVPIFDLVVTAGGVGEPTLDLEPIEGTKAQMAQVGTKGMFVGVVGIFDDKENPLRYQRVPLDSSFPDSPQMLKLLADYQEQLRREGLEGLGATEQPHPSGRKFVGSEKCGECHTKAYAVWEKTPHAHATDSIVTPTTGRGDIPRHFDPECLSCHVTGWEPQKFYPFTSGYLSLEKSPLLKQNGCENCHGPGSAHVEAEEGSAADAEREKLRAAMRLPLAGGIAEKKCMECHDLDNSPDFHVKGAFEKYWKEVEHVGKD